MFEAIANASQMYAPENAWEAAIPYALHWVAEQLAALAALLY